MAKKKKTPQKPPQHNLSPDQILKKALSTPLPKKAKK